MNKSISTYRERAQAAREAKDRYTVDQGQRCICHCGQEHWKRKEVEKQVESETKK